MLKLYATPLSANGRKVLAVSRHLGLNPEIHDIDVYRGEGRSPEYLAVNPSGKIPTLIDGEFVLFESNAILLYLAEAHGANRLWSSESRQRSRIAQWLFWESAHWQPVLIALLSGLVGHRLLPERIPSPRHAPDWSNGAVQPILNFLESQFKRRCVSGWICGGQHRGLCRCRNDDLLSGGGFPISALPEHRRLVFAHRVV